MYKKSFQHCSKNTSLGNYCISTHIIFHSNISPKKYLASSQIKKFTYIKRAYLKITHELK